MAPLAADYVRATVGWHDKLVLATLQTFGVSTTTVSQLQWSGVRHEENGHAARCAIRNQHLLDWFEAQLIGTDGAFVPGVISAQDIFLTCFCQFIETRPLRLSWRAPNRPKLASLVARMGRRPSLRQEAALWREPGMTYATAAEVEWARHKTIHGGPGFSEWASQSAS
jgi:glutathione S-transferase